MEWEGREESQNVEDRRGMGTKAGIAIGGGGILTVVVLLIAQAAGVDLSGLVGGGRQGADVQQGERKFSPEEERQAKFTKVIFRDTEVVWDKLFAEQVGKNYKKPTLVLFTDYVQSACGGAGKEVGPFYCPADGKVYIDVSFYATMAKDLRAPGEFPRAYVIAHEVGHHVQRFLDKDYSALTNSMRKTREGNEYSVRLELQADFLAGVWAHHANREIANFNLTDEDIRKAIDAARAIGDDTLQKRGGGRVRPETFSHGTSQQRMAWFKYGLETGDVRKAGILFQLPYKRLMPPSY